MSNDPYVAEKSQGGLRKIQVPAGDYEDPVSAGGPPAPQSENGPGGVPVRTPTPEILSQMRELEDALVKEPEEVEEVEEVEDRIEIDDIPEEALPNLQTVFYRHTAVDNPKVRGQIEERCDELDFTELIISGRVQQQVPILEGKLTATFHSLKAADNLWIERQAMKSVDEVEGRIWAGYARLVASLLSVNEFIFENHLDSGDVSGISSEKFSEKYKQVMDQSERVIEILLVNLTWFEDRVGAMFAQDSEALKNG